MQRDRRDTTALSIVYSLQLTELHLPTGAVANVLTGPREYSSVAWRAVKRLKRRCFALWNPLELSNCDRLVTLGQHRPE